ncbi:hypothetical protein OSB04_027506 [Centaurea solstitialis]|uniref:Phosphatidic acid phosphatase type 2/haloperoxidase domain-containing protein n=1 Tax=Centaurea solstitialis TaxID=347529 RepID=A0AA38SRH1_9ASTR|nr:hypothetical protein OSB04_027506 [Centaurea solstitialis]
MVEMPIDNRVVIDDKWINNVAFELCNDVISYHPKSGLLHILLNGLSKWCIAATYYGVVVLRHDDGLAVAVWAVIGSVLNVALSFVLKQIIRQDRPVSEVCSGPGMPSSHAQSISFAVVYVILSIVGWLGLNAFSVIFSGLVIVVGVYLSWLRILLRYHTTSQVVAGAVVGSVFSVLWFCTCDAMVLDLEAYISSLWL